MRFCVIDTETTGLKEDEDRVTWIACDLVEDGRVVQSAQVAIADVADRGFYGPVPANVSRLPRAQAISWVAEYLAWAGNLVAHNAAFDTRMLQAEFAAVGLRWPAIDSICTMKLAQRVGLQSDSLKLVDCCQAVGWKLTGQHQADHDVRAATVLLLALLPMAAQNGWVTPKQLVTAPAATSDTSRFRTRKRSGLSVNLLEGLKLPDDYSKEGLIEWSRARDEETRLAYAKLTPAHRAAHERDDAFQSEMYGKDSDRTEERVFDVLHDLTVAGCPEVPRRWMYDYALLFGKTTISAITRVHRSALDELVTHGLTDNEYPRQVATSFVERARKSTKQFDLVLDFFEQYATHDFITGSCGECYGCRAPSSTRSPECFQSPLRTFVDEITNALDNDRSVRHKSAVRAVPRAETVLEQLNASAWARLETKLAARDEASADIAQALVRWEALVQVNEATVAVYDRASLAYERDSQFTRAAELALKGADLARPEADRRLASGEALVTDPTIQRLEKRAERCSKKAT